MDYDVIIVGAGPAGCAAAYDLCSNGRSVLLLDRTEFPRVKACAGGITIKALKALRYSVSPIIRRVCYNLVVGKGLEKTSLFKSTHPICAMTVRAEFDDYCLKQTKEQGASFAITKRIHNITDHDSHIELEIDQGVVKARFLIGADGANSTVRRLTGLFPEAQMGVAIEAHVPLNGKPAPEMEFDFGAAEFGYGWLFPKDDHINVGVYSNSAKLTKKDLAEYAMAKLGTTDLHNIVGQAIGWGGWTYKPESNRIFLVGDAAGLIDPLLGEGIYNAIKSGQVAANAIDNQLEAGTSALSLFKKDLKPIQRDAHSCYSSALWFYRLPGPGFIALTVPTTRDFLMKGFAIGLTFSTIKVSGPLLYFKKVPKIDDLLGLSSG